MSKEEMIQAAAETLQKLYYEDAEFFCKMIERFAEKKGGKA